MLGYDKRTLGASYGMNGTPDGDRDVWHDQVVSNLIYNEYGDMVGYSEYDLYAQMDTVVTMVLAANHAVERQTTTTYDHDGYIDHLTNERRGVGAADVTVEVRLDIVTGRRIGDKVTTNHEGGLTALREAALAQIQPKIDQLMAYLDETQSGNLVEVLTGRNQAARGEAFNQLNALFTEIITALQQTGIEDLVHFAVFFQILRKMVSGWAAKSIAVGKRQFSDLLKALEVTRSYIKNLDSDDKNDDKYVELEWDAHADIDEDPNESRKDRNLRIGRIIAAGGTVTQSDKADTTKWTARYAAADSIKESVDPRTGKKTTTFQWSNINGSSRSIG